MAVSSKHVGTVSATKLYCPDVQNSVGDKSVGQFQIFLLMLL